MVRRAIAMSASPSRPTTPKPPANGPLGSGSNSSMICIARIFGAPLTVPTGRVAASKSHASRSSQGPSTSRNITWLKRSTSACLVTCTIPGHTPPNRCVQINEHGVLGVFLGVTSEFLLVAEVLFRCNPRRGPGQGATTTWRPRAWQRIRDLRRRALRLRLADSPCKGLGCDGALGRFRTGRDIGLQLTARDKTI